MAKTYKGIFNRHGSYFRYNNGNVYSLLQIGDDIITKVQVNDRIVSYLDLGEHIEIKVSRLPFMPRKHVIKLKIYDKVIRLSSIQLIGNFLISYLISNCILLFFSFILVASMSFEESMLLGNIVMFIYLLIRYIKISK